MRTATRLLSVALVLGSAHASAEPAAELLDATAEVRMREYYEQVSVAQFLITPRRLATGAPACGNVGGKRMPEPCTLARADQLAAIRHAEMLASVALAHAARTREVAVRKRAARELATELARRATAAVEGPTS
jgi:hypothetical protein